jgi:hypothetical protein
MNADSFSGTSAAKEAANLFRSRNRNPHSNRRGQPERGWPRRRRWVRVRNPVNLGLP